MKPISENAISLEFPFTAWDRVWSNLVLIPQRKFSLVIHLVFPFVGFIMLWLFLSSSRAMRLQDWLLIAVCLSFTPLITTITVLINHITNKTFREPFTYAFDDDGIHVRSAIYQYSNPWSAITSVKPLGGFLMFFFAPGTAHAIPIKFIHATNQYDSLLSLARANGVQVS